MKYLLFMSLLWWFISVLCFILVVKGDEGATNFGVSASIAYIFLELYFLRKRSESPNE